VPTLSIDVWPERAIRLDGTITLRLIRQSKDALVEFFNKDKLRMSIIVRVREEEQCTVGGIRFRLSLAMSLADSAGMTLLLMTSRYVRLSPLCPEEGWLDPEFDWCLQGPVFSGKPPAGHKYPNGPLATENELEPILTRYPVVPGMNGHDVC